MTGFINDNFQREVDFLKELVRVPSDNPPDDCARHYSVAGIPTVLYGAGPRTILDANAHGADEHLKLSDLKPATKVIEATLRELLASK